MVRFGARCKFLREIFPLKFLLALLGSHKQSALAACSFWLLFRLIDSVNFLDLKVLQHVELLIDRGVIEFVHFGTPGSSFSVARKNDGGPPPLRDAAHLWGLPGLSPKGRDKVQLGNKFMWLTAQLAHKCSARGVGWSIENPASSFCGLCRQWSNYK